MKISNIHQAQTLAKTYLRQCGEHNPNPVCTRETETLFGLESREYVCIINKCNGRVLWLNRRLRKR